MSGERDSHWTRKPEVLGSNLGCGFCIFTGTWHPLYDIVALLSSYDDGKVCGESIYGFPIGSTNESAHVLVKCHFSLQFLLPNMSDRTLSPIPSSEPGFDDEYWLRTPSPQRISIPETPPTSPPPPHLRVRQRPVRVILPTRLVFEDIIVDPPEVQQLRKAETDARNQVRGDEEDLRTRLRRRKRDDYEMQQLEVRQRERRYHEYLSDLEMLTLRTLGHNRAFPIVL